MPTVGWMHSNIDIRMCVLRHLPDRPKTCYVLFTTTLCRDPTIPRRIKPWPGQLVCKRLFADVLSCLVNALYLRKKSSNAWDIIVFVKTTKMKTFFRGPCVHHATPIQLHQFLYAC